MKRNQILILKYFIYYGANKKQVKEICYNSNEQIMQFEINIYKE